jgi:nucleotide-binding universal stress UspA family protein
VKLLISTADSKAETAGCRRTAMNEPLVIDRPDQQLIETAPSSASSIKTILFHVHNDDGLERRLQVALSVARACGAHLHLLHVTPIEAYSVIDAYGTFVSGEIVQALQDDADKVRVQLESHLAKEDVTWDYDEITGELMPHLIQYASLADLIIVGRERPDPEFARPAISFLGDLLHRARTPLLVIGDECERFDPLGPAVIAWNGSYEAANAMRDALGLLKIASSVHVLTVEEENAGAFPSTRALEYLSRQGIHAELAVWPCSAASLAEELVSYAQSNRAAYVVMGGYGHSRAGEFLFGGTTRDLLTGCPISLVIGR